ncbi:DUF4031 domain-containing protein [Corticibacter populi]|nr:DUF4031 domain-containing protein [Corticibacter populi]RZS35446.1 uncharacterized protein DUF4031 [Corticibacter populi]
MVYVDDAAVPMYGYTWFHLMADSVQELHAFAANIGIHKRAFHIGARHPHYDVTATQRRHAIRYGARPISAREAVLLSRRVVSDEPHAIAQSPQLCLFV